MCHRCGTDSGIPVLQRPAEPSYLCVWQSKLSLDNSNCSIIQTVSGCRHRWASDPQKSSLTISKAIQPPPPQYPNDRLNFSSAKTSSKCFHIGVSAHRQWTQNTHLHLYAPHGQLGLFPMKHLFKERIRLQKANSNDGINHSPTLWSPWRLSRHLCIHESQRGVQQQFPDVLSLQERLTTYEDSIAPTNALLQVTTSNWLQLKTVRTLVKHSQTHEEGQEMFLLRHRPEKPGALDSLHNLAQTGSLFFSF